MTRRACFLFIMITMGAKLIAMDFLPFAHNYEIIEKPPRSYEAGIDYEQLEDLRYVLTSLAYNSFSTILADRVSLQEAMMHVDEVHPFHFIMAVFTDAQLAECMHIIHEKQWLWRHFYSSVKRTLNEESQHDNLCAEYILEMCQTLGLEFDLVQGFIVECDWDSLVDYLFETFPSCEE